MKIDILYRNDPERGLTDPLPEPGGRKFIFRIYSGDICDPIDGGQWFGPNYPKRVWRTNWRWLPFVAWRWPFTNRGGYFGFKLYGADRDQYLNWMNPEDVYSGSQACCLSFRPFADIVKG